jgi:hypothetical protein
MTRRSKPVRCAINITQRIHRHQNRETERIGHERERIVHRLHRLSQAAKSWGLLRISDEFAAVERAAERAKWRSYELYMWLGREEIKRQNKAGRNA